MSIQKKITLCALLLLIAGLCAVFLLPRERDRNPDAALRAGAGDDASGYLLERVLEQTSGALIRDETDLEAYAFQDC